MKSYKENWKKLIGIGVVALAALLVLIGIGMIYHEKVKKDAGVEKKDRTVVSSYGQAVILGERPVIIGERINPTGKPRLKQALKDRDMAYILNRAASQDE